MQLTNFATLLLLASITSTLAIPTRHTRSSVARTHSALDTAPARFLTTRDVANIVDQILVERGLVWEEADDLMERMMLGGGGGGNGHGNGGHGGPPVPPAPPNSPSSSPEVPKKKQKTKN